MAKRSRPNTPLQALDLFLQTRTLRDPRTFPRVRSVCVVALRGDIPHLALIGGEGA